MYRLPLKNNTPKRYIINVQLTQWLNTGWCEVKVSHDQDWDRNGIRKHQRLGHKPQKILSPSQYTSSSIQFTMEEKTNKIAFLVEKRDTSNALTSVLLKKTHTDHYCCRDITQQWTSTALVTGIVQSFQCICAIQVYLPSNLWQIFASIGDNGLR